MQALVNETYRRSAKLVGSDVLCGLFADIRLEGCTEVDLCTYRGLRRVGSGAEIERPHRKLVNKFADEGWISGAILDATADRRKRAKEIEKKLILALREDTYSKEYRFNGLYGYSFTEG